MVIVNRNIQSLLIRPNIVSMKVVFKVDQFARVCFLEDLHKLTSSLFFHLDFHRNSEATLFRPRKRRRLSLGVLNRFWSSKCRRPWLEL